MNPPTISIIASGKKWSDSHQDTWHLTDQVKGYEHTIKAVGGYWSAKWTIRGGRDIMDSWLQDGLGRHIEVYDDTLTRCWEGYVNKVSANYGPLSVVRGPLMDMCNVSRVVYSAIEYDADDNPVVGTRVSTDAAEDTDSIDLWAEHHMVLAIGGAEASEAEQIRDTYIDQNRQPTTTKEWTAGENAETGVTIECLGYVHWLTHWAYLYGNAGTQDADTKLHNIFIREPNLAWLVWDETYMEANTVQVPAQEIEDNMAWSVIKDIVARGGTAYERWLFGIYDNFQVHYHAAPTTAEYQQRLSQPRSRVENVEGDEVYPWKVKPGKWLIFPDFLIGQAAELDLQDDPRAMFIEDVRYMAPWDLQLKGGSMDTVNALVAQLGLMGIG